MEENKVEQKRRKKEANTTHWPTVASSPTSAGGKVGEGRGGCLKSICRRLGSKRKACASVPYHVCLALMIFKIIVVPSLASYGNDNEVVKIPVNLRVIPPVRAVPADTILLENGSTTFVSTLEEYLSWQDKLTTAKQAPESSLANSETTTAHELEPGRSKSAALVQLEREDTTGLSSAASTQAEQVKPHHETAHQQPNHNNNKSEPQESRQEPKHSDHNKHGHDKSPQTSGNGTVKPIPQHYQVKSLLNVTQDYPLAYSQIICGYVWPLMAAITLFTNLMIVFVLTQRDMRTPTNVVLTAIAIADIIPIVVPVPWFVYLFAMGNEKQVLYPPIACYFYQHSTRSVSEVFYFLSTWLNVLLAVHDYLTACWPKLAKKYCQIKVVIVEIIALTLLAFLLNLPQALKLVFKPVKFYYKGELTYGCKALQAKWFKDLVGEYVALYDDIFTAIIVLFVDGGPAIALITLTALLIRQLQRQRIEGHLLMEQARTASKRRRERHRQQESEASARVLIFVLLAFLAVKIPFATTYTLMIIQSRFEIHFVENLVDFQKAISLTDLVFVLSYPINFTIFCCLSKKFRHKCAQLLGECDNNTGKVKNRLMSSFSGSVASRSSSLSRHFNGKRDSTAISYRDSVSLVAHEKAHLNANNNNLHELPPLPGMEGLVCINNHGGTEVMMRRQSAVDKLCDGKNHFDLSNLAPSSDADSDFRTLNLEDGSLCFECIMRSEQMKRMNISGHSSVSSAQRHPSTDSNGSWPIHIPPPPPPPMLISQLPSIITTTCDSISERPSSEEANGDGTSDVASMARSETNSMMKSGLLAATSDNETGSLNESKGTSSNTRNLNRFLETSGAHDDKMGPRHLQRPVQRANSTQRVSSDPGPGFLDIRRLLRRFSGHDERNSPDQDGEGNRSGGSTRIVGHAPPLSRSKHRSLSLSNSKLSTLPNATGMLADVMMSTLFGGHHVKSDSASPIKQHGKVGKKEKKKDKKTK